MSANIYDEYAALFEACRHDWRSVKEAGFFGNMADKVRAYGTARSIGLDRGAVRAMGGSEEALKAMNGRYQELIDSGVDAATARSYLVKETNSLKSHGGFGEDLSLVADSRKASNPELAGLEQQVSKQQAARKAALEREQAAAARQAEAEAAQRARTEAGEVAPTGAPDGTAAPGGLSTGKALALAGGTSLAAGGGAYAVGSAQQKEIGDRNRNLAFGAGLAGGAVAPQLMGNVKRMLGGQKNPQQQR